MFHLEDVLQLKDDEQVKTVVRRHVATLIFPLFVSLLCIVTPFFLLFPLFAWGIGGVIIFFSSVLFGIVVAIRALMLWDADVLIVTSDRIVDVDQRGLLMRTVSESMMPAIQDVTWSCKGLGETVCRMGSVSVKTSTTTGVIEALRIPRPEKVADLINSLRHATRPKRQDIPADRATKLREISDLLEGSSYEELSSIEQTLKAKDRSDAVEQFLKK